MITVKFYDEPNEKRYVNVENGVQYIFEYQNGKLGSVIIRTDHGAETYYGNAARLIEEAIKYNS